MAWLGPLTELELNHLDLRLTGLLGEALRVKVAVSVPAAKVAATQFPDQVSAMFEMVGADGALASVVGKVAQLRPLVQGQDGIGTERAKAHRGDIENRGGVGLPTLRSADQEAKLVRLAWLYRQHRVADELIARPCNILQCTEGEVGGFILGPGVHQRALSAGEGQLRVIAFDQVLTNLWTNALHQIAHVTEDRVVAPYRMASLKQVVDTQQA